jgi:hypothetical protein
VLNGELTESGWREITHDPSAFKLSRVLETRHLMGTMTVVGKALAICGELEESEDLTCSF